jgi:hypothetical protein
MASNEIESSAAIPFVRGLAAAVGKVSPDRHADGIETDTAQPNEPAQEIELPLKIDPGRGIARIGIEALEGLLAEIGSDDCLTLRLSIDEVTPVHLGLALASPEAEHRRALSAALDFAAALIHTERRA